MKAVSVIVDPIKRLQEIKLFGKHRAHADTKSGDTFYYIYSGEGNVAWSDWHIGGGKKYPKILVVFQTLAIKFGYGLKRIESQRVTKALALTCKLIFTALSIRCI